MQRVCASQCMFDCVCQTLRSDFVGYVRRVYFSLDYFADFFLFSVFSAAIKLSNDSSPSFSTCYLELTP